MAGKAVSAGWIRKGKTGAKNKYFNGEIALNERPDPCSPFPKDL